MASKAAACSNWTTFTTASAGCSSKARPNCSSPKTKRTRSGSTQPEKRTPYVKDAFHRYLINDEHERVNPAGRDESGRALFVRHSAGQELDDSAAADGPKILPSGAAGQRNSSALRSTLIFTQRKREADEFYAERIDPNLSEDARLVQRQAFAGLLWSKQATTTTFAAGSRAIPRSPRPIRSRYTGAITTGRISTILT